MLINRENLVFGGGGVLGIAYLGVLQYLYQTDILKNMKRVAGTSAGAITACIASFNLPFENIKEITESLIYNKIPEKEIVPESEIFPVTVLKEFENLFDDYTCVYRLLTNYGWYSSDYLYQWMQETIASQFDSAIKPPPYTFADFKNSNIHIGKKPFLDLYITGTSLSFRTSEIFSYETTPDMEVAKAVRVSMSIPLFFEAVKITENINKEEMQNILCDGGIMWNYPIRMFDLNKFQKQKESAFNMQTLGAMFLSETKYHKIDNLLDFIRNLYLSQMHVQQDIFKRSPEDMERSILIDTGDVSAIDFDIKKGDKTYNYLIKQGYEAAINYFRYTPY